MYLSSEGGPVREADRNIVGILNNYQRLVVVFGGRR
jgi:hypothetical protein